MTYREMVASLAMVPNPDDSMGELTVPDLDEPLTGTAIPRTGRSLTGRALRSLPEQWRAVLWPGVSEDATPAQIVELLRSTESASAALSHRALDGLRAAYLRIYLDERARPECRPAAGKLGDHVRRVLSRRDTRLVSRHLGRCAQCGAIYADLVTMDAALRGVIAPLIVGSGPGAHIAAVRPAPAAPLVPPLRRAGHRAAVAAAAAVALVAVAAVGTILTLNSRPARDARHPAAAGSPAATSPARPPGLAGPGPSSAAITRLARPSRPRSPASPSRPTQDASRPPASTAPVPSASATLGSGTPPAPSPSPPCLVLPPLRLC
jgi:hypothetical protein